MRRYRLVDKIGDGLTPETAFRPDLPSDASWVLVCPVGANHYLVKHVVPAGSALTNDTVCDTNVDGTVVAASLTNPQRTAIKNFLTNRGFDISQFDSDGVIDRARLLRFILNRLAQRADLDGPPLLKIDISE
jgi:hypothetical protein